MEQNVSIKMDLMDIGCGVYSGFYWLRIVQVGFLLDIFTVTGAPPATRRM
jgi:hypothetical protein